MLHIISLIHRRVLGLNKLLILKSNILCKLFGLRVIQKHVSNFARLLSKAYSPL